MELKACLCVFRFYISVDSAMRVCFRFDLRILWKSAEAALRRPCRRAGYSARAFSRKRYQSFRCTCLATSGAVLRRVVLRKDNLSKKAQVRYGCICSASRRTVGRCRGVSVARGGRRLTAVTRSCRRRRRCCRCFLGLLATLQSFQLLFPLAPLLPRPKGERKYDGQKTREAGQSKKE